MATYDTSSAHRFRINSTLRRFSAICGEVTEQQLLEIMTELGEKSAERAPRDEGNLAESMRVEVDTWGGNIQGRVIFGTPEGMEYVVVQHEHTDFEHPNGGEAKFLEKTVDEMTPKVASILARALRDGVQEGLSGGG